MSFRQQYVTRNYRSLRRQLYMGATGKVFAERHAGGFHNEVTPKPVNNNGKVKFKNRRRNKRVKQG